MESKNITNGNLTDKYIHGDMLTLERGLILELKYNGRYLEMLDAVAKIKYYQHVINITIQGGNMEIQLLNYETKLDYENRKRENARAAIEKARGERNRRLVSETTIGTYKRTPRSRMPDTWR